MKKQILKVNMDEFLNDGKTLMDKDIEENLQTSKAPKQASFEESNQETKQYSFEASFEEIKEGSFESTNIEINKEINKAIEHLMYRNKMIRETGLKKKKDIINKALFEYLKKEFR